jgi:hypothetical protein
MTTNIWKNFVKEEDYYNCYENGILLMSVHCVMMVGTYMNDDGEIIGLQIEY